MTISRDELITLYIKGTGFIPMILKSKTILKQLVTMNSCETYTVFTMRLILNTVIYYSCSVYQCYLTSMNIMLTYNYLNYNYLITCKISKEAGD